MLLSNSPIEEIYNALKKDKEKLVYILAKNEKKAQKEYWKSKGPPFIYVFYYTNPSTQNRYFCYYLVTGTKNDAKVRGGAALVILDDKGLPTYYVHTTERLYIPVNSVITDHVLMENVEPFITTDIETVKVIIPHVLSRYRERVLAGKNLKHEEIVVLFIERELGESFTGSEKEQINNEHKANENNRTFKTNSGYLLYEEKNITVDGEDIIINKLKTFLTEEMLKGRQKKASLVTHAKQLKRMEEEEKRGFYRK